jgi:hypothetical protein
MPDLVTSIEQAVNRVINPSEAQTAAANEQGMSVNLGGGVSALYQPTVVGRTGGPEGGDVIYGQPQLAGYAQQTGANQYNIYTPGGQFSHAYSVDPNESLKGVGSVLAAAALSAGLQGAFGGRDLTGGGELLGGGGGGAGVDTTYGLGGDVSGTGLRGPNVTTTGLGSTGFGTGLPADYLGANLESMYGGQGITGGVGQNLAAMNGGQGLATTLGTGLNLTGGVGGAGPLMTAGGLVLPGGGTLALNTATGLPLGSTVLGTDVVTGTGGLTTLGGLGNAGVTVGGDGTLLPTGGTGTVLTGGTTGGLGGGTTGGGTVGGTGGGTTGGGTGGGLGGGTGGGLGGGLGGLLTGLQSGVGLAGLLSGLGSLFSGALGAQAANKAAEIQQQTALAQMKQQRELFDIINAQQAPYRQAGYGALSTIGGMLKGTQPVYDATGKEIGTQQGTGYLTQQYTPELFQQQIDPGYAFRLAQGQMAAQRAGNVAGGGLGGNVMRGLQDYTQGLASTEYGNAFNRFQQQRQNIYNTLAGIAGIGQTGQAAANQAAQQYGQNVANLATGAAGAQAAGTIGAAQGYGAGISGLTNSLMLASLLGQNQNVAGQSVGA